MKIRIFPKKHPCSVRKTFPGILEKRSIRADETGTARSVVLNPSGPGYAPFYPKTKCRVQYTSLE